ncbi:phospholipase A [Xylophilus sp. GW821-FHT01B05]
MDRLRHRQQARLRAAQAKPLTHHRAVALAAALLLASAGASAQTAKKPQPVPSAATPLAPVTEGRIASATAWQQCAALSDSAVRLACFDQWAHAQQTLVNAVESRSSAAAAASASIGNAAPPGAAASAIRADVAAALASAQPAPAAGATTATDSVGIVGVGLEQGCKDRQYSTVSRFWELESGSSCPTFSFRGFRANGLSVVTANNVNRQPTSGNPNNSASTAIDYQKQELRLQLSVRTKLASGLLTPAGSTLRDSLWVAYSQQSYWQFFNTELSRPFRSTDYEPELIYVYPTTAALPFGWNWRYSGAGLVHQSNGQSDPLSRSWNRVYLMTGFEHGNEYSVNARIWKRLSESALNDNNPGISNYVGRGELLATWNPDRKNTFMGTVRNSFGGSNRGSVRLEWLRSLGDGVGNSYSGLRLHTQLFSGYGDSIIDYNNKRTVFSVGFSIVDF